MVRRDCKSYDVESHPSEVSTADTTSSRSSSDSTAVSSTPEAPFGSAREFRRMRNAAKYHSETCLMSTLFLSRRKSRPRTGSGGGESANSELEFRSIRSASTNCHSDPSPMATVGADSDDEAIPDLVPAHTLSFSEFKETFLESFAKRECTSRFASLRNGTLRRQGRRRSSGSSARLQA